MHSGQHIPIWGVSTIRSRMSAGVSILNPRLWRHSREGFECLRRCRYDYKCTGLTLTNPLIFNNTVQIKQRSNMCRKVGMNGWYACAGMC